MEDLAFSCNDKWLASIGGQDDNSLVVWNLETGKAVCGLGRPCRFQSLGVRDLGLGAGV